MKALTISQPYASLIASGRKWVENRTWPTTYRGPLAIHAGKGTQYLTATELRAYPSGVFVATCELVTCLDVDKAQEHGVASLNDEQRRELDDAGIALEDILAHEHTEGPVAWVLTAVRECEPLPAAGKQQLWDVPLGLLRQHASWAF